VTRAAEGALLTLVFTTSTALVVVMSLDLSPVARRAPLLVALPTLALLAFELLADVSRIRARSVIEEHSLRVRERALILWAGVLLASSALLGMLVGLPAFLLLYLRYRSAERWTVALAVAAGFWTLLYGVLVLVLRLPLYAGRLWSWL